MRSGGSAPTLSPTTLVAAAFLLPGPWPCAAAEVAIATETDSAAIVRDLAELVAPAAGFRLDVIASPGPAESLRRLRAGKDVKLATVPSDLAAREDAGAGLPLRVVVPLHREEIHFVARADAPFGAVHEIGAARINVGPPRSGTAETVAAVYRRMFDKPLDQRQASFLPHEEALVKLVTDRTVDVVAIVAAQPANVLASMRPEARQYVKLLKLDREHAASKAALKAYVPATLHAASYPTLLEEDLPALAATIYLVTLDFRDHATESRLIRFARALCHSMRSLRAKGHPKWQEVELRLTPLAGGLDYYQPTTSELSVCKVPVGRARAQ